MVSVAADAHIVLSVRSPDGKADGFIIKPYSVATLQQKLFPVLGRDE